MTKGSSGTPFRILTAVPPLLLACAALLLCAYVSPAQAAARRSQIEPAPAGGALKSAEAYTVSLPVVLPGCRPLSPGYSTCAVVARSASLYSGPGVEYYTWLGSLSPGTSVAPLAHYGDYAKIAAIVGGREQVGFVPKNALSMLPSELPELAVTDVPWKEVDLVQRLLLHPNAAAVGDAVVLDNSASSDYDDVMPLGLDSVSAFTLTFQIDTDDDSYGAVKLADLPAAPTDEWWKDVRRLDLFTDKGSLGYAIYDGLSPSPFVSGIWNVSDQQALTIVSPDATGKMFVVLDQNGNQIDRLDVTAMNRPRLAEGLFPSGRALLGRVVSPGSRLTLRSLALALQPTGMLETPQAAASEPTLRRVARSAGIAMGTEYAWWLMTSEPQYWRTVETSYDTLILSQFSSPSFWPARGVYDFASVDFDVNWALRYGYRVRASHLVWGALESNAVPDWLVQSNFTRDEYIRILEEHVKTVVGHFKGRVKEWSIANEAANRSFYPGGDFWNDKIGPEYIAMAFRWAREADPDAVLIFNDTNNESPRDEGTRQVIEKMMGIVKELKAEGVPIDVVGMQMHLLQPGLSQSPPKKADVIDTMRQFAVLGVKIYVTEMDVNLEAVAGTQSEKWQFEANLYRDMVQACIESGVCTSFATWGVTDKYSWLTCSDSWCLNLPDADPLLFDKNYQPKPAFFAVHSAFARAGVADRRHADLRR
ncbi:MAG: endo-1,4-beta-xylanase [Caldilineaceae bacterium]